jgi:hypothetical protein
LDAAAVGGKGAEACRTPKRLKRIGQFWSAVVDEAVLCLDTFWRNERWHELFPHTRSANLSKN